MWHMCPIMFHQKQFMFLLALRTLSVCGKVFDRRLIRAMILFVQGRGRCVCFANSSKKDPACRAWTDPRPGKLGIASGRLGGERIGWIDNNKIVTFKKSGDNNWARHLKKSVKLTCLNCHPFTNLFWYHFDFCSRQNMLSSHFVFLTHFLFGRKVVCEGFVFRTVTTFAAAPEIIFQLLRQIGKPM